MDGNQYKRILVAVDGTDSAEKALKQGIDMAKKFNAELFIAHIIDTRAFQSISSYDEETEQIASAMANQTLSEYAIQASKAGVSQVTTILRYGIPKKVLAYNLIEEHHIDLVLLGSTNSKMFEKMFLGSLSNYLTKHATCDVVTID
ncbi:universal stress protein [Vagococcus xieshaowenii]|uniref:Universal stress protein n=1 Tax=Vagococcus xieshaowenii TaxID=2562451 RepID=A0AAJ5EH00_9ENTE|nr:universal stress protein [Vagococcus xieshaowenii]QCA29224.1 universal stress protein [Vagococcus xieshaowenii]TFZ43263.1 universal stress protein [Vagococcus xieshaowenii]